MRKEKIKFNINIGLKNIFKTKIIDVSLVLTLIFGFLFFFITTSVNNFEKSFGYKKYNQKNLDNLVVEFVNINLSFKKVFEKDLIKINNEFPNVKLENHEIFIKNCPIKTSNDIMFYTEIVSSEADLNKIYDFNIIKSHNKDLEFNNKDNTCLVSANINKNYFDKKAIGNSLKINNETYEIVGVINNFIHNGVVIPYEKADKINSYELFGEEKINRVTFGFSNADEKESLIKYFNFNDDFLKRGYQYEIIQMHLLNKTNNSNTLSYLNIGMYIFFILMGGIIMNGKIKIFESDYLEKENSSDNKLDLFVQLFVETIFYGGIGSIISFIIFLVIYISKNFFDYNIYLGFNIFLLLFLMPLITAIILSIIASIIIKRRSNILKNKQVYKL